MDYPLKSLARQLRKSATKHESILWKRLRGRHFSGFKFKRQQQLGDYIVNFFCFERGLIIELDGDQHGLDEHRQRDRQRDEWLHSQFYTVLRFSNSDVTKNLDGVVQTIWNVLNPKKVK